MKKHFPKMMLRVSLLTLVLFCFAFNKAEAQDVPPFVYNVENTGTEYAKPPLPPRDSLPIVEPLTDPFEWSDGNGRDTTFESWAHRRAEIKAEIENYEIGPKPDRPDTIEATYVNGTLTVNITKNGETLTLTSSIILPSGDGPFPAIIGVNSGSGSLPSSIFSQRNVAQIPFIHAQVMAHQQTRGSEPINKLYPELTYMGAYSAWSWGVSRLIDGLELVADDLPIDLEKLAVSGCSYAGKMALFAGAFDERIALTIAQESGGGGAAAWRVSRTLDDVETLSRTDHTWFMESMFQFGGVNVSRLPHDHHELMAMVAPRALLVLGNPDYQWLADESGYVSCVAAKKVWENFDIDDRMGYSIVGGHGHCALPQVQYPEVEAFVDKFLLGDSTANTDVAIHPFKKVMPDYWYNWWGTENPEFPVINRDVADDMWLEAECATVGSAWNVRLNDMASNEAYVIPKFRGGQFPSSDVDNIELINFPFTLSEDKTIYIYARTFCPTFRNDAIFMRIDDENFLKYDGLLSDDWEWNKLLKLNLKAGSHNLAIHYADEGFKLDKLCITDFGYTPGDEIYIADNVCTADTTTVAYNPVGIKTTQQQGYVLEQNFPNPSKNSTHISFQIPQETFVSLKIYSLLGEEIMELAGKQYPAGKHAETLNLDNLADGIYYYALNADDYTTSRKMIVQKQN